MGKVTVFRVEMYDPQADGVIRSKRMATLKGAMKMNGWAVGEGVAVDDSCLVKGEDWTVIGFEPPALSTENSSPRLASSSLPSPARGGFAGSFDPGRK